MDKYYKEHLQIDILKQEFDRFATSLQNKKSGCFTHRFEELLNEMPKEFRNQMSFRNKIQAYIKESNYNKDVKEYSLQVFSSFFEPTETKTPDSLKDVIVENESYKNAMAEGYLNFENEIMSHYKETSYTSPLSFDVFTQNHEDYISEFDQKRNELDGLILQYELEYYKWLKTVSHFALSGIDYENPPTNEVRELLEIEVELLDGKNPKKVYDNCFRIVDFLESGNEEIGKIFVRYSELFLEYLENKNLALSDTPKELHSIVEIDIFTENYTKAFEELFNDGKDSKTLLKMIDFTIQDVRTNIKNPLLKKNKSLNEYLFEKLKGVKILFQNLPQQTEIAKPDEVKKELHNHIFKDNAFKVWQSMFGSFQITESSRTDVKFMFEEMKKDGLIFNTVNQTTFLDWISETYQITIQKTSNYSKTKERISIYSNAKQLYKS